MTIVWPFLLLSLLAAPSVAATARQTTPPGSCSGRDVMRDVTTLAADSMMGRAPGSRGDSLGTAYLMQEVKRAVGSSGVITTQEVPVGRGEGTTSRNIIATIPGARSEWVVLTAHHDGLGIGKPDARGDSVYNGANDNAVGVALALCVVRTLAPAAGRRGVILILTAAEERGRLGARYWAEHPTVPVARVKFAVNLDAIGVTGPTLDFIAYGKGMLIGADSMLQSAGARAGFALTTVSFESSMYWAFDSAELAAVGIPAITIGQGMRSPPGPTRPPPAGMPDIRRRYHTPSDEVAEDWDSAAIVRYGELAASLVEAARTDTAAIRLRSPNVYQQRP